jgi:hypothetical protein
MIRDKARAQVGAPAAPPPPNFSPSHNPHFSPPGLKEWKTKVPEETAELTAMMNRRITFGSGAPRNTMND